jgi:hypothetical protein
MQFDDKLGAGTGYLGSVFLFYNVRIECLVDELGLLYGPLYSSRKRNPMLLNVLELLTR